MTKAEYIDSITIRIRPRDLERIKRAAERRGQDMSNFIRHATLLMCDRILGATDGVIPDPENHTGFKE